MIRAAWLLLVLLAGCAQVRHPHDAALYLRLSDGSCSGTAVGPHTVLTATHCFEGGAHLVAIDGVPVAVSKQVDDQFDHSLVTVSVTFESYADLGPAPVMAQHVYYFGNPGRFIDLYRDGRVYGSTVMDGKPALLYGLNGFPGDSGSGIFDDNGCLVGVISFVWVMDDGVRWQAMGSFPLQFTPAQWAEARS